jgi:hypothetical protein
MQMPVPQGSLPKCTRVAIFRPAAKPDTRPVPAPLLWLKAKGKDIEVVGVFQLFGEVEVPGGMVPEKLVRLSSLRPKHYP